MISSYLKRNAFLTASQIHLNIYIACYVTQMTYCGRMGEESCELIAYLQAVPGVTPIKPGANPATWWVTHRPPGAM